MEQDIDHKLTLIRRSKLTMTGVKEVISFDENTVALQTCMGTLVIQGEGLQLRMLSVEGGQVAVEGTVESLQYAPDRPVGSLLRRLFT
jgi:sporulation protein YabP